MNYKSMIIELINDLNDDWMLQYLYTFIKAFIGDGLGVDGDH